MRTVMAVTVLVVLAGCGSGGAGGNAATSVGRAAGLADWNATDACATVGKAAVAEVTSRAVTEAELNPVSQPDGLKAGFSMCTFALADGAKMTVLTREAADGDVIERAIAEARTVGEEFGSNAIDVPGIGRAAMWTDKPASLQVFIDDRRYATISMFGADFMPDASDRARTATTAIARKLAS